MLLRIARLSTLAPAAVLAGCAVLPGPHRPRGIPDPPEAHAEHRYYEVSGGSAGELLVSLRQLAPAATQTDSNFARTTWTVVWHGEWSPARDGSGCEIVSSTTALESQVALPKWKPAPGATPGLAADWSEFARALASHENGHLQNAVAAAHEVDTELKLLRAASCDVMESTARAEIDRIVATFRLLDEGYDYRTRNGAVQGAVWPPQNNPNLRAGGTQGPIREPEHAPGSNGS